MRSTPLSQRLYLGSGALHVHSVAHVAQQTGATCAALESAGIDLEGSLVEVALATLRSMSLGTSDMDRSDLDAHVPARSGVTVLALGCWGAVLTVRSCRMT